MLTNIISFLLEWITLNTHYDASIFKFEVIELSKCQLQALACGGKCPVIAFFKPEVGILISELDFENICNQSIQIQLSKQENQVSQLLMADEILEQLEK